MTVAGCPAELLCDGRTVRFAESQDATSSFGGLLADLDDSAQEERQTACRLPDVSA